MKISYSILLLFFCPLFCFSQESKKITLQNAIEKAIETNYDIQKQRYTLDSARAQYRQAKGALDIEAGAQAQYTSRQNPVDKDDPNYMYGYSWINPKYDSGIYSDNTLSQQSGGSIFLKKLFNFGLETKLSYSVKRLSNRPEYSYSKDYPGQKYESEKARNSGEVSLELSLPLFKSFKDSLSALQIDAAKAYLEQMEFALNDTISKTIISVSTQYWTYLIAFKNVEQLEIMQSQLEERNKNMDSLIRAGVRSKNDMLALQVNVNENRRSLQNAKVKFTQAKTELMTSLGILDASEIGDPEDSFSSLELESIEVPLPKDLNEEFFTKTEENRADIQALKKKVESAAKKVRISQVDKRPDANLNFGIGASGANYSDSYGQTLSSGFKNVKGVNISGTISVSAKLGNNVKKGINEQAQAEYEICLTDYTKAKNTFMLQIQNSAEKLKIYKNLVTDADNVLSLQKALYENEKKRFNAGLITVDNLLNQDQKYIAAELSYYQVLTNYMQAILEFKYYSAQLVE